MAYYINIFLITPRNPCQLTNTLGFTLPYKHLLAILIFSCYANFSTKFSKKIEKMQIKITVDIPGLGHAIKEARNAKGLSQSDLGYLMHLSTARISELETESEGKSSISIEQLIFLEEHLNVSLLPFIEIVKAVIEKYENLVKEE